MTREFRTVKAESGREWELSEGDFVFCQEYKRWLQVVKFCDSPNEDRVWITDEFFDAENEKYDYGSTIKVEAIDVHIPFEWGVWDDDDRTIYDEDGSELLTV